MSGSPISSFDTKLSRIIEAGQDARHDELARNLLHAYVACLTADELAEAVVRSLDLPLEVRSALRNRVGRLAREAVSNFEALAERLLGLSSDEHRVRRRVHSLLSALYPYLLAPTRQAMLERWRDLGTRDGEQRWLKAICNDDLLFSAEAVFDYWRTTGDWDAIRILSTRATPEFLRQMLPDLLRGKGGEGWIVSRATLGASFVSEESWAQLRAGFPASYAYLCAKTGRSMDQAELLELVLEAEGGARGKNDRGLLIWAIGQMGLFSVLERIRDAAPKLRERDLANWRAVLAGGPTSK